MVIEHVTNVKAFGVQVRLREGDEPPRRRDREGRLLVKGGTSRRGSTRVVNDALELLYLRNPNPFGAFRRSERLGDLGDLAVRQVSTHRAAEGSDGPRRSA
jgi:hypothetical protein